MNALKACFGASLAILVTFGCGGSGSTTAGGVGSSGGAGGPSGGGGTACVNDGMCSPPTPYCSNAGVCVGCLADTNCAGTGAPHCSPTTHSCVACATDAQCQNGRYCSAAGHCVECLTDANCGAGTVCDTATNQCVMSCTSSGQCGGNTPYCSSMAPMHCVECLTSTNCGGGGGGPVCDPVTLRCVECLTNADCGRGGTCDAVTHTCN